MRHLLAEPAPTHTGAWAHLPATAKVQIFSERSKSGAVAERLRSGSQPNGNLTPIMPDRMANCQRGETPTMHKL